MIKYLANKAFNMQYAFITHKFIKNPVIKKSTTQQIKKLEVNNNKPYELTKNKTNK
tara:strand:- start:3897 stop:4064 length:168 start_codon:yes stop_codon:yes gene_type:complete